MKFSLPPQTGGTTILWCAYTSHQYAVNITKVWRYVHSLLQCSCSTDVSITYLPQLNAMHCSKVKIYLTLLQYRISVVDAETAFRALQPQHSLLQYTNYYEHNLSVDTFLVAEWLEPCWVVRTLDCGLDQGPGLFATFFFQLLCSSLPLVQWTAICIGLGLIQQPVSIELKKFKFVNQSLDF